MMIPDYIKSEEHVPANGTAVHSKLLDLFGKLRLRNVEWLVTCWHRLNESALNIDFDDDNDRLLMMLRIMVEDLENFRASLLGLDLKLADLQKFVASAIDWLEAINEEYGQTDGIDSP